MRLLPQTEFLARGYVTAYYCWHEGGGQLVAGKVAAMIEFRENERRLFTTDQA